MIPLFGAFAVAGGIFGLMWYNRDLQVAKTVWIPLLWLLIASSRPISSWITFSAPVDASNEYIDGSPLDRNVLTFLLILAVIVLIKRRVQIARIVRANPLLVAYFTFCLVSMLWADYPFVLFKRWIRSVGDVSMMLVILTEPNWRDALRWVLLRIAVVLLPLSILFIRFYPSLGRAYSNGGVPMWTGVATDKNALGALCMITGVALLWWGLTEYRKHGDRQRTRHLVTSAVLFAMVVYLLLVANSQTALTCFGMASILIVLTSLRLFRNPAVIGCVVAAMLTTCFCVLFLGIGSSALSTLGRNSTLTGRTEVWQTVLPFARNPLLGAGYENFWIGERLRTIETALGSGLNQAHNGYIEIYLNIGWVGISLLGLLILSGYGNIMSGVGKDPEISRLKLAYFFICLVYNFTEAAFKMMSPVWMLFLLATMALPEAVTTKSSHAKGPRDQMSRLTTRTSPIAVGWYGASTSE